MCVCVCVFDIYIYIYLFIYLFWGWFYKLVKINMAVQLIRLRGELDRLHDENGKLRGMLDQITKSYSELQGQLLMAMQKQAQEYHQGQVIIVLIIPRSHRLII